MNVDTGEFEALSGHMADTAGATIRLLRSLQSLMRPEERAEGRPVLRVIRGGAGSAAACATVPAMAGGLYAVAVDTGGDVRASGGRSWPAERHDQAVCDAPATAPATAGVQRTAPVVPLVAPRRMVASEGRHEAPGGQQARPAAGRIRTGGRHRRPGWRNRAAGWLRRGFWLARDAQQYGPLTTAA